MNSNTLNNFNYDSHLRMARILARLLDNQFHIGRFRIGLDPIIGLIPWAGDLVTGFVSLYIIWTAWNLGIPKTVLSRMLGNILLDTFLGLVPFLGDIFDLLFKSNLINLGIIDDYLAQGSTREKVDLN